MICESLFLLRFNVKMSHIHLNVKSAHFNAATCKLIYYFGSYEARITHLCNFFNLPLVILWFVYNYLNFVWLNHCTSVVVRYLQQMMIVDHDPLHAWSFDIQLIDTRCMRCSQQLLNTNQTYTTQWRQKNFFQEYLIYPLLGWWVYW